MGGKRRQCPQRSVLVGPEDGEDLTWKWNGVTSGDLGGPQLGTARDDEES